jgi:carbamoyl-phosphate synthase large subunit
MKSGVLIGGDIACPQLATVAKELSNQGFKLYCSSPAVESFLNSLPYLKVERIFFPVKDKRKLLEVMDKYNVQLVINLAKTRGTSLLDEDYVARRSVPLPLPSLPRTDGKGRRNAVDFGIPLINHPLLAQLFVEAMGKKMAKGELEGYTEGRIPSEVRSWSEFIGSHA